MKKRGLENYIKFGLFGVLAYLFVTACAPIEYTIVITEASGLLAQAEEAGAACSEEQLKALSQDANGDPGEASALGTVQVTDNVTDENNKEISIASPVGKVDEQDSCHAPFEYYFAKEFLNKAREEVAYSDYQAAIEYAQVAKTYANQAYEIATQRRRERGR